MKQFFTCLIIFIFPFLAFSQCKYEVNEVDDFTNERKIVLKKSKLVGKGSYNSNLQFSMIGETFYITIHAYDKKVDCYTDDTKMMFKFVNGDVITIQNIEASKSRSLKSYEAENGDIVTIQNEEELNCDFKKKFNAIIDKPTFTIFKEQELEKIRIVDESISIDHEVEVKNRFKISKQASCLDLALRQSKK